VTDVLDPKNWMIVTLIYLIGMLASAMILTAITLAWKISVHCAGSSAAVCIVALTYNPLVFSAYALVGLVTWSRVALGGHTVTQVVAGSGLGAIIAVLTYHGALVL
jgi:membrane-associated phospholipid phosphatase